MLDAEELAIESWLSEPSHPRRPQEQVMSSIRPAPALFDPGDLEAVAAALCSRFGDPTAEAYRLSTLHDVLRSSHSLAASLEMFARAGNSHYRGVHCTADMHVEVEQLSRSLLGWMEAVFLAGSAYREWQRDGEVAALRMRRASEVDLSPRELGDAAPAPALGLPPS
jgi:hypothetical protein